MEIDEYRAIDPAALILRGKALEIYYLIHHPHEPSIEELHQALAKATPEELQGTLAQAKAFVAYATAVVKAIETLPSKGKAA
ncbi:MAG: hypothetical protein LAO20_10875 [Acidobacteriia bacterium]|nr:hypothetical protein [Terriglobia bacterium]